MECRASTHQQRTRCISRCLLSDKITRKKKWKNGNNILRLAFHLEFSSCAWFSAVCCVGSAFKCLSTLLDFVLMRYLNFWCFRFTDCQEMQISCSHWVSSVESTNFVSFYIRVLPFAQFTFDNNYKHFILNTVPSTIKLWTNACASAHFSFTVN